MHRVLSVMAMLAPGPALAGTPAPAHTADASHLVFACSFKRGSVSVTVSGGVVARTRPVVPGLGPE